MIICVSTRGITAATNIPLILVSRFKNTKIMKNEGANSGCALHLHLTHTTGS